MCAVAQECDDSTNCCSSCRLTSHASCSGECCPLCTPAPTGHVGTCSLRGGFCYGGVCTTNTSALWYNGMQATAAGGVLKLSLESCPLLGGGCTVSLLEESGGCADHGMHLRDGTACGLNSTCAAGICVPMPVCGDGIISPSEACDESGSGCTACTRTPPLGVATSCGDGVVQEQTHPAIRALVHLLSPPAASATCMFLLFVCSPNTTASCSPRAGTRYCCVAHCLLRRKS